MQACSLVAATEDAQLSALICLQTDLHQASWCRVRAEQKCLQGCFSAQAGGPAIEALDINNQVRSKGCNDTGCKGSGLQPGLPLALVLCF